MADGSVRIDVELDAKKLQSQIQAQSTVVKRLEQALKSSNQALDEAKNKQSQLGSALDQAKQKYSSLGSEMSKLKSEYNAQVAATGDNSEAAIALGLALEDLKEQYAAAGGEVDKLQGKYDKQGKAVDNAAKAVDRAGSAYSNAQSAQQQLQRSLEETNLKLKQQSTAWATAMKHAGEAGEQQAKLGKALTAGLTAPLTAISTYAAKAAIDFESAFAGVQKTVDGTTEQLDDIRQGIIGMAGEIPQTTSQLASIAEAAGQLGVSTEGILAFTRVIADLREATNLGEDAAANIAQFANITKMQESDYANFGSTIVELGNNFATTEQKILDMSMRIAGAGTQVGMTQHEILAFATALSSVGIEAQAGGSSISRIMTQMQLAVAKGGTELKDFARVAGMSSKDFQKAFKANAATAINSFIVGLSKMDEKGITAIETLDKMGITELRLSDTLLRASNANELFSNTLTTSASAWEKNTALATEAEKRYATFASRLQIAKNQATAIAQELGEEFVMPALEQGLSAVDGWIKGFQNLSDAQKQSAVNMALIAAGVGPVLTVFGKANTAIDTVVTGIGKLGSVASAAGGGVSGLVAGFSSLVGPAGYLALAAAGIYGLVKGAQWLADQMPTVGDQINRAFEAFDPAEMQLRSDRMKKMIDAQVQVKAKTTVTMEGDSAETQLDKLLEPIIAALEAGKPVDAKLAVSVNQATVNFIDGLIEGIEADAQAKINQLDADLKLGKIDATEYNAQVAQIQEDARLAISNLKELKSSATSAVSAMVGDTDLTVDDAKKTFESFKSEAQSAVDYANSIPGLVTVGSLFSTIQTSLTDGKPDDPNWLRSQVEEVFSGQVDEVNAWVNTELAKLDINDPNYDTAKQNVIAKGEDMTSQLTELQTAANEFIERMSGKATSTVQAHMGELKSIEQRAREVIRTIQAAVDADRQQAGTRADLIKGGYVRDTTIIEETLAVTYANYQIDLQSVREQADAAKEEVLRLFRAGEIKSEEVQPKIDEIDAALGEYEKGITSAYQRELDQLMAGVTKAYSSVNPELKAAADKIDMADALRGVYDKIESGTIQKSDITPKIAEAVGLDVDTLWQMIQDGLDNPDPLMGKLSLEQMFKGVADQIEAEALSGAGKELGEPGKIFNTAIMNGLYDGLEGVDMSDGVTKYMAMLGKLIKDPDRMPDIPFEATIDTILHPPEDGGAETRKEAQEQLQDQLQAGDGTGPEVEVPVNPKADVQEPTGGESVPQQISDAIEKQTEGAPTVTPEVGVAPEAKIEEPADGTSPADAARESVAEDAKKAVEPVPIEITLTATVTMDTTSNASATEAGKALAQAVVDGAKEGMSGTEGEGLDASGGKIAQGFADGITNSKQAVSTAAAQLPASAKEGAQGAVAGAGLQSVGTQIDAAVATGINTGKAVVTGAAGKMVTGAKEAARDAVSGANFQSVGTMMDAGVATGITQGKSTIISAAQAVALLAKQAFEAALGIASPAKEMIPDGVNIVAGVAKGVDSARYVIEAAMNNIAGVVSSMSAAMSENATRDRAEQLQQEIDAIEAKLEAYERMMKDKRDAEELAEKRAAIKRAKNKKDRIKAQEELNRTLDRLENDRLRTMQQNLQAELDAYRANIDTLVRAYDFMGEQIMVALKNQYSQQRDAQMAHLDATADAEHEALEARYDAQQKYHDNYMKMLDAEEKAEIAKYQALIDAIDAEQEAEDEAKRIARDAAKIAELQAEVNRAKNAKFRAIAQKALEEEIAKQAEEARKRERAAQKEALKAEIDNIEEQYDEKRDLEKERMEQIKEQYDAEKKALDAALAAQRAAWSSHYNTLLSEENLQAEARRLLLEENNEEMIALLESYNPQWYNAGRSFGELFVEALGVQMDNVEALINQVASLAQNRLDWIKAQVAEMQSVSGVTASDVASSISSSSGGVATLSSILQGSGFSSTAVYYNQTLEFNQPIQSPSDVTYAVRKASQEAAYAL